MRITITIPDDIYEKLEEERGLIPRSTYIQDLITKKTFTDTISEHAKTHIKAEKKGKKELPSQSEDGFTTFFKK